MKDRIIENSKDLNDNNGVKGIRQYSLLFVWLGIGFFIIGFLFVVPLTLGDILHSKKCTEHVVGTVMYTKYTHSKNDDGKEEEYPYTWIAYFDKNHEAHIKIVNDELENGTEVELRYNPDDPDDAIADGFDPPPLNTFLFGVFAMTSGVIFFVIGRFVLW